MGTRNKIVKLRKKHKYTQEQLGISRQILSSGRGKEILQV